MGSICRLCLHKNNVEEMKNVFEFTPKYFQINITEILYWIFDVEIVVEDHYSKLICYKCMNVIESVGKYRQFFQVNQTFLHERRCPTDYEVESGWYNTRDIGTNTDVVSKTNNVIKSVDNSLKSIGEKHVKMPNFEEINTTQGRNCIKQQQQNEEVEWINVPFDVLKEFSKPSTVKDNTKKNHDRIDVPAHIFSYYSPCVTLPDLKEECSNEGITKVGGKYYKFGNQIPHIKCKRIEEDKDLLKKYKKTGKFTFKKVSPKTQNKIKKKRKLICDYYYRMPTSALRELISETNNEKLTQVLSITSLVKTNEIHVHVCKYCSKVFKSKKNLSNHYIKIHKKLLRNKYKISDQVSKKNMNNFVEVDPLETSSDFNKSDELDTYTNNLNEETIHHFSNANVNESLMQTEVDPLSIPVSESSQRPSGSEVISNGRKSIRVKDVRKLINCTDEFEQDNCHIDYLRTVVLGKSSGFNPKISYYSDSLKEHNYSTKVHQTAESSTTEIELLSTQLNQNPRRKKISSNIAKFIKKRLDDIKKTRQELEKMTKIRFALYNEIDHCNIKSSISALEQKLQTAKTNDLV